MDNNKLPEKQTPSKKKIHLSHKLQITLVGLGGVLLGGGLTFGYMEIQQQKSPMAKIEHVYNQIQDNYYKKVSSSTLQKGAISGMLNSLDDPYSQQLSGSSQQQINQVLQGSSFGGVGIQMKVENNKILVDSIVTGSPASKSNIKSGDQILAVDGKSVSAAKFDEVSGLVRGKKGTKVTLTLKRDKTIFKVTLTRATITQSSVTVSREDNAVIIKISQFDSNTAEDLKKTLKPLKENQKVIIDLQDNPGGMMNAAVTSASYFLPNGTTIMSYRSRSGSYTIKASKKLSGNFKTKIKPIILINENTASASEIFTAALVQNKKAVSVGQTSYGKGTVQEVETNGDIEYKYTTAKWLTPDGSWINGKGLKPTYSVETSSLEQLPQFQTSQTLKLNVVGLDVAILQEYLHTLGYLNTPTTGVYNVETQNAVSAFQKEQGLAQTGIVDEQMRQRLYLVAAQKLQKDNPALKKALSLNY